MLKEVLVSLCRPGNFDGLDVVGVLGLCGLGLWAVGDLNEDDGTLGVYIGGGVSSMVSLLAPPTPTHPQT